MSITSDTFLSINNVEYLDYDPPASIDISAFLFKDDVNAYHVMINYTYPIDNSDQSLGGTTLIYKGK